MILIAASRPSLLDEDPRKRIAIRQRFFMLFAREYAPRRAVTYVRCDQGDDDTLAPSLFLKGKRARVEAPTDDKPADEKPANNTAPAPTRPIPQDDPFVR